MAKLIQKLIFKWQRRAYDGLEGVVSFSAKIIAAARALESETPGALFSDPLARHLAGERAIARAQQRAKELGLSEPVDLLGGGERRLPVGRIAVRTLWFDRQLLAALQHDTHPQPLAASLAATADHVQLKLQPVATPKQVVLLGAGLDTRAWRLPLPPAVQWFEVDRADVLAAKSALLSRAGAGFENSATNPDVGQKRQEGAAYPLLASQYASLAADLGHKGWTQGLEQLGFDRNLPTVWLAEGLLMYLQPAAAHAMLQEIAGASAPGSVLLTMSVNEAVIASSREGKGLLKEFVFGCPDDPRQMLEDDGWRLIDKHTRTDMLKMYDIPARLHRDIVSSKAGMNSYFMVATPL